MLFTNKPQWEYTKHYINNKTTFTSINSEDQEDSGHHIFLWTKKQYRQLKTNTVKTNKKYAYFFGLVSKHCCLVTVVGGQLLPQSKAYLRLEHSTFANHPMASTSSGNTC